LSSSSSSSSSTLVAEKVTICVTLEEVMKQPTGRSEGFLYWYKALPPDMVDAIRPGLIPSYVNVRASNLWVGRNITSRIHLDGLDNLLVVLQGSKTIHLYPPQDITKLKPTPADRVPVESGLGSYLLPGAKVVLDQQCQRYLAVLRAGDAIIIPAGWWHEVFTASPEVTIVVNFWCELVSSLCSLRPTLVYLHSQKNANAWEFLADKNKEVTKS